MKEEWRQVTGYDSYWCSSKGRIYSTKKNGGKGGFLTPTLTVDGSACLSIYNNGKTKKTTVAKIVATEFIPKDKNSKYVRHKDGNASNNSIDNLYWSHVSARVVEYKLPCETNEMLTIQEFQQRFNLSLSTLGVILRISRNNLQEYLDGEKDFTPKRVERLRAIGIEASQKRVLQFERKIQRKKQLTKKVEIIKDWQIAAMKRFGNTIISKKHSKEEIIAEFGKYGYDVQIREFRPCQIPYINDEQTHYVVTEVGRGELYDKRGNGISISTWRD